MSKIAPFRPPTLFNHLVVLGWITTASLLEALAVGTAVVGTAAAGKATIVCVTVVGIVLIEVLLVPGGH